MKRESKYTIQWNDGNVQELKDFLKLLIDRVDSVKEGDLIRFYYGEKGDILTDAEAELAVVNGAMCTVGGDKKLGERYELKFSITEGK